MGKVIHWELCKQFKFDHANHTESAQENDTHKLVWDFEIQTDHLISARRPDLEIGKKKKKKKRKEQKRTYRITVKSKENKKNDKYVDLARELKKLWNMKVTVKLIVIRALGTVTKGWAQELEDLEIRGRVEVIQTTALLRSARILKRVPET